MASFLKNNFMKVLLFLLLSSNFIFYLMSETLLASYANTLGILVLGIFTIIWQGRIKKQNIEVKKTVEKVVTTVAEVKDTVDIVHVKINSMRDKELAQTKDLGEAVGQLKGAQDARDRAREAKIDSMAMPNDHVEPVKVIVSQPADVNIVKDETKKQ